MSPFWASALRSDECLLFGGKDATLQTDFSSRVLVVEDFEDLRKVIAFYLHSCGYKVLEAANGRGAIQTALRENPGLILLDLRLPDLNGVEVARELHRLPQTKNIPIIGWSAGFASDPQVERLRQAGIVDYLQKPTKLKDLQAAIDRFLLRER